MQPVMVEQGLVAETLCKGNYRPDVLAEDEPSGAAPDPGILPAKSTVHSEQPRGDGFGDRAGPLRMEQRSPASSIDNG